MVVVGLLVVVAVTNRRCICHRVDMRDRKHHTKIRDHFLSILSVGPSWPIDLNCLLHLGFLPSFLSFLVYLSESGYRNLKKNHKANYAQTLLKTQLPSPCLVDKTNKQKTYPCSSAPLSFQSCTAGRERSPFCQSIVLSVFLTLRHDLPAAINSALAGPHPYSYCWSSSVG